LSKNPKIVLIRPKVFVSF